MSYNASILSEILRYRALSRLQLSQRLGMPLGELDRELKRAPEPKQTILNDIAKELALPSFVFFMKKPPELHDVLPDFRSKRPAPSPKSRSTIEAIQLASSIQSAVTQFGPSAERGLPRFLQYDRAAIEFFALRCREFFSISVWDQAEAADAKQFYVLCRKKIEDKGIFVLHDSFPEEDGSGFCLSDRKNPVIVVNTKRQTRGRRLFTLIHELAHVLAGQSGISDPFVRTNQIERACNQFAAAFLVPSSYVDTLLNGVVLDRDPDLDAVAKAARRLRISQQAAVLRLEELGRFDEGSHDKWKKAVEALGNPDFSEKGGGSGGPPPQEKVKLAKYGFRFARAFGRLLEKDTLSEIEIYRHTGLKPKYQRSYFKYANNISGSELRDLGLDDE